MSNMRSTIIRNIWEPCQTCSIFQACNHNPCEHMNKRSTKIRKIWDWFPMVVADNQMLLHNLLNTYNAVKVFDQCNPIRCKNQAKQILSLDSPYLTRLPYRQNPQTKFWLLHTSVAFNKSQQHWKQYQTVDSTVIIIIPSLIETGS